MTDVALPGSIEPALRRGPDLDRGFHPLSGIIFMGVIGAALLFVAYSIYLDVDASGTRAATLLPFILLFVALLIALSFEFVNGFHDTANAVATVIYTHSLPAHAAVVWSGLFNLVVGKSGHSKGSLVMKDRIGVAPWGVTSYIRVLYSYR